MVELVWKKVDSVEMFGYNLVTSTVGDTTESRDFVFGPAENLKIGSTWFGNVADYLKKSFTAITTLTAMEKQTPVSERVGNYVAEKLDGAENSYYAELSSHIDMKANTDKTYNCKAVFQTTRGNGGVTYPVTLANVTIDVDINESITTKEEIPLGYVIPGNMADLLSGSDTRYVSMATTVTIPDVNSTKFVYDFGETYPAFTGSKSFEYIEQVHAITEYLAGEGIVFSEDEGLLGSGAIIHKNGFIKVYPIFQKYGVKLKCANWTSEPLRPTGGFDLKYWKINTVDHGWKPNCGEFQDVWDAGVTSNKVVNYELYIFVAYLGSMMQVYLFSPSILIEGQVAY